MYPNRLLNKYHEDRQSNRFVPRLENGRVALKMKTSALVFERELHNTILHGPTPLTHLLGEFTNKETGPVPIECIRRTKPNTNGSVTWEPDSK
jgi:hypothetical protein